MFGGSLRHKKFKKSSQSQNDSQKIESSSIVEFNLSEFIPLSPSTIKVDISDELTTAKNESEIPGLCRIVTTNSSIIHCENTVSNQKILSITSTSTTATTNSEKNDFDSKVYHNQESSNESILENRGKPISMKSSDTNITEMLTADSQPELKKRGLGTWKFDRIKRKKYYISLSGQRLDGSAAVKRCRDDQIYKKNPNISARPELVHLMSIVPNTISEVPNDRDPLKLGTWGLPVALVEKYRSAGVERLFPWQLDCLLTENGNCWRRRPEGGSDGTEQPLQQGGRNLVYSAPTSGGKTMVVELIILRTVATRPGLVLFVVPFVSLAEEKARYLQDVWADLQVGVRAMHGEDGGTELTDDMEVVVCTIERANIIATQLLEDGQENRLSLVVADEVHLIGDSHRGFLLEVMLSKLRFVLGQKVQIVAMSATLPNMSQLAQWLDATLFTTEYRPVSLLTRVCCSRKLFRVVAADDAAAGKESVLVPGDLGGRADIEEVPDDPEGLLGLVLGTVRGNKSVLVFCPSKSRCETVASRISEALAAVLPQNSLSEEDRSARTSLQRRRLQLLNELRQCPVGLCPQLRVTAMYGVAYHHAGLTVDERKILEHAFRSGSLSVLVATSTLAAGVNLPAHRVVIRTPKMGPNDLSIASFRQMCGRAGRMLLDSQGEAVLMIENNTQQKRLAARLCTAAIEPLRSALKVASGGGLEKLLLEMISCRRLTRLEDVDIFVACTLLYVQCANADVVQWAHVALNFLVDAQFVLRSGPDGALHATPLGRAASLSGIAPRDAIPVLASLQRARRNLILRTGFHPIFLCTPPAPCLEPNWQRFEVVMDGLLSDHPDVRVVLEHLGADWSELCKLKMNPPRFGCDKTRTCFYRRLYSAVVVFSLTQEMPLNRVAVLLDVKRGQIQQLQKDTASFCGMAVSFCKTLNWDTVACVLESYSKRLGTGVRPELLPLVRLGPDMPGFRARAFYRNGLCNAGDISAASVDVLVQILLDCMPYSGRDPLTANQAPSDTGPSAAARDETLRNVCRQLAERIKRKAKEMLQEELSALAREEALK